jgi:hypothetical protein
MYTSINGWTKEKIISFIKKEFKGKSVMLNGKSCAYRGINGAKCAVGMFIPDSMYDTKMENLCTSAVVEINTALEAVFPLNVCNMEELQSIHDGSNPDETLHEMIDWIEKNVE